MEVGSSYSKVSEPDPNLLLVASYVFWDSHSHLGEQPAESGRADLLDPRYCSKVIPDCS